MHTPIPNPKPTQASSRARSRLTLILLAALFAAPIAVALLMQSPLMHYSAPPTKNFGELISPVVPLDFSLAARLSAPASEAEAVWSIVYLPSETCGACVDQLDLIAHIKQATGREMRRVRMEVWSNESFQLPPVEAGFTVRGMDASTLATWRQQLGLKDGGLVIVDPLGNAMMRYSHDFDGTDVRKDLQRLLRTSQTGKRQSTGIMS